MDIQEFKKIARLLKEVYRELQIEALKNGISLDSAEYDLMVANTRSAILSKMGFTDEEYRVAKIEAQAIARGERVTLDELKTTLDRIKELPVLTKQDVAQIANDIVKSNLKAPEIINKIVKEVTIQQPQIVKETIIETTVKEIAYNEEPIKEQLAALQKRVDEFKQHPPVNIEAIKEDIKLDFGAMLKDNINIFDMPDWRKLAMGLQGQIDALGSGGSAITIKDEGIVLTTKPSSINFVGAGVTATAVGGDITVTISTSAGAGYQAPLSGVVDGSNTVFVWASAPNAIMVDGAMIRKVASDTTVNWTGTTTTTLTIAPNFDIAGIA